MEQSVQPEYEVTRGLMGTGMRATVGMGQEEKVGWKNIKCIAFVGNGEL